MSKKSTQSYIFEQLSSCHRYCLVQMHEDPEHIETEFSKESWPHHTTLAGVFSLKSLDITDEFEHIAAHTLDFSSIVTGYDTFGDTGERVRVALLLKTKQLLELNSSLCSTLERSGSSFKSPARIYDAYTPHITDYGNLARFAIGSTVRFDQLSLVDLDPNGDKTRRRIVWQSPDLNGRLTN